ncbi:MAG: YceI family protein [Armatimonadetes bacterium]|nr:YceI family protein [Armatimonadota bacterium]
MASTVRASLLLLSASAVLVGFRGVLAPITFDMKDPKGVSGLTIKVESMLEPVRGHATGISGNIVFDPEHPEKSSGKIVVDAKTTMLGSEGLTQAMHQSWCMDVDKYPTIEFAVKKIDRVKKTGADTWTAQVTGDFTFHGVTKTITVNASATHLPNSIKKRGGMPKDGDLLIVRSAFSIKRSDYKVAPDLSTTMIGDTIELDLATVGVAPK